ncbi:MAG: hypothetical protein CSA42_06630 [Gammaproteobacteria bacterium]|nr:MAG: hypothetical protein CSA42_06630 [Gammaproteobacteria bacterium]
MVKQQEIRPNFWQKYRLDEMNHAEWEALCDGCGVCCLVKFLDDEDNPESVEYTNVACQLLDCLTGRCSNYTNRQDYVPDCINLTVEMLPNMMWLPNSCAYKRLYKNQPIPEWHFLITKNKAKTQQAMLQAKVGVAGRCVSEAGIADEELEDRIITWVEVD